jgi:hypothetical protein
VGTDVLLVGFMLYEKERCLWNAWFEMKPSFLQAIDTLKRLRFSHTSTITLDGSALPF